MSTKNGMGNDKGLLRTDVEDIVAKQPKYRIEIAPRKVAKVGHKYTLPYPVSINEIYVDVVPKLESEIMGDVEVSTGRGTGDPYAWVVCVTPITQTGKEAEQAMYAAAKKIKDKYPEWSSSISVVRRAS